MLDRGEIIVKANSSVWCSARKYDPESCARAEYFA
jgi:hypothetical protein